MTTSKSTSDTGIAHKVIGRSTPCANRSKKAPGVPYIALADFIAPAGTPDFLGGFAVTAGPRRG
jgi:cobalamin-dependent methionine synthase I